MEALNEINKIKYIEIERCELPHYYCIRSFGKLMFIINTDKKLYKEIYGGLEVRMILKKYHYNEVKEDYLDQIVKYDIQKGINNLNRKKYSKDEIIKEYEIVNTNEETDQEIKQKEQISIGEKRKVIILKEEEK